MISKNTAYWNNHKRVVFRRTYIRVSPIVSKLEAELMKDVEYPEVNELFQRFKDFEFEMKQLKQRIEAE